MTGSRDAAAAHKQLQQIAETGDAPGLAEDLRNVGVASSAWHLLYADPVILTVRAKGKGARDLPSLTSGKVQFDQVRAAFAPARRQPQRAPRRASGPTCATPPTPRPRRSSSPPRCCCWPPSSAGSTLRRTVATPLSRLARDARRIARGEFDHPVAIAGPRDIQGLSTDVESMRRRIISELEIVNRSRAQLEEQTVDLQRSNAELEQFAYVASHDLQEPLRKVASFTGMLQHRYQGQLDERADQYIDFAVDGAKRMQVLINDLLAFSRVGRVGTEEKVVAMDEVAADAIADLGAAIEESGAQVTVDGPLPQVRGDRSLLTALLQNLFANAIKFRGEDAAACPVVVRAHARSG